MVHCQETNKKKIPNRTRHLLQGNETTGASPVCGHWLVGEVVTLPSAKVYSYGLQIKQPHKDFSTEQSICTLRGGG